MKKFLALVCMITCIFGLTACGSEEFYSEYQQKKVDYATQFAAEQVFPVVMQFADGTMPEGFLDDYTVEEIQYKIAEEFYVEMKNGFAFRNAVESFGSGLESIGSVLALGDVTAKVDDDQIIVYVQVDGELNDAEAEIIISNDMFMTVQSAALNPIETIGDLMTKAALNTLIGMGTVFVVLVLICLIISCFAFIPKIQAAFSKKNKKEDVKTTGIDNAMNQIATQEESVDASDDLELVAVIAAAIAASEGAASADGFVVRSIRKVNRGRR